jgi:uncharacterized membrane protein
VNVEQHPVERWTSQSLKLGVFLSGGVMIAGLLWYAARSFAEPLPLHNPTVGELLRNLLTGSMDPFTLMYVGLFLLMLTPFLRVLTAVAGFAAEKNRTFVFVSLLVFFLLITEFLYSLYR